MIPREEELIYRTRWLVRVRWFVVLLMAVGAGASALFGLAYSEIPLLMVAAFVAAYNVLFAVTSSWAVGKPVELGRAYRFVNIQIATDFVALLVWVHYTGGPASPFLPFFVFHLVICGLLVSRRMMLVHAAWVFALLVLMGVAKVAGWLTPHWPLESPATPPLGSTTYLLSVAGVTLLTFVTIAVVVGGIATRLRGREGDLDETRRELEHHARQVETAHAALEELHRERSAFFRLVSHQLRSPLSSIQTVLKLISTGYAEDPAKAAELVSRAEVQSHQMLALINDMLSLTRIKEMNGAEDREMVALGPLIADAVEEAQNAAHGKSIALSSEIDPELPSIPAVRHRLEQMFAVLVQNAVKYTPQGGSVSVRADYSEGRVRVDVQDTGIGIPADDLQKIFSEFYRASNARRLERVGTGLGLSIAKKVAEDLGGRIEATSTLGQGSTFSVILPVPAKAS